jgi:hypothetical protein
LYKVQVRLFSMRFKWFLGSNSVKKTKVFNNRQFSTRLLYFCFISVTPGEDLSGRQSEKRLLLNRMIKQIFGIIKDHIQDCFFIYRIKRMSNIANQFIKKKRSILKVFWMDKKLQKKIIMMKWAFCKRLKKIWINICLFS